MKSRVRGFLYFFLTVVAVVITLRILNWVPLVVQKETLRRYDSVDEVRSKLSRKDLRVPSYFPQTITWPPAVVLGQGIPYPAVVMVFNKENSKDAALVLVQAESEDFPGSGYIRFSHIKEKVIYQLKGRRAVLEVGNCSSEDTCSRLSWYEGRSRIELTMKAPPVDLLPIAESMLQ